MEIQINNHPVDFELQQEMTVVDIVNSINGWSSQRDLVFSEVHIDGEAYSVDDIPDRDLGKVSCINCIIRSKSDLVFSSIDEGARYCMRAGSFVETLLEDPGKIKADDCAHLASGMEWLAYVTGSVMNLAGMEAGAFVYKDRSVADYIMLLNNMEAELRKLESSEQFREYFRKNGNVFPVIREIFRMILMSEEMKKLILHSIDSPDVILTNLIAIKESMPDELQNVEDIAVAFQTGKDKDGIERLNRFINFIFHYIRTCYQLVPVFGIELNGISHNGQSLDEKNDRIQALLQETIEIMENSDFISLSDILEYEIKPAMEDLEEYIEMLVRSINET